MRLKGESKKAKGKGADAPRARNFYLTPRPLLTFAFCLLPFYSHGCAVDERRDVPAGARATVECVNEDIAAGRDVKVYEEAANEWRDDV